MPLSGSAISSQEDTSRWATLTGDQLSMFDPTTCGPILSATSSPAPPETGKEFLASPADWGPHVDTGRVADISPGLMNALGIETDDEIEIEYPV